MSILSKIKNGFLKVVDIATTIINYPFYLLSEGLERMAGAGERLRSYFPFEHRPPKEKIKAALREQWLNLEPGEKEIPGVEFEGEIYYETPK